MPERRLENSQLTTLEGQPITMKSGAPGFIVDEH